MSQADDTVYTGAVEVHSVFTIESCYAAGLKALDKGELEEAQACAKRCDAIANGEIDARCAALHGIIAAETGNLAVAAIHLRKAAQLAPDDVPIARQLSQVLASDNALGEAITALERVLAYFPDDADLLVELGYLCMLSDDQSRARAEIERAASLRPEDSIIHYSLAQIYQALGESALAASVLIPMASHAPLPRVLNDLTLLLLQLRRWGEAEATFVRLQQLDPDHAVIALHGRIWCHIQGRNWRDAFDLALVATRLDRYDLTTTLLAYTKDQFFGRAQNGPEREAELGERVIAELREHAEFHSDEDIVDQIGISEGEDYG